MEQLYIVITFHYFIISPKRHLLLFLHIIDCTNLYDTICYPLQLGKEEDTQLDVYQQMVTLPLLG